MNTIDPALLRLVLILLLSKKIISRNIDYNQTEGYHALNDINYTCNKILNTLNVGKDLHLDSSVVEIHKELIMLVMEDLPFAVEEEILYAFIFSLHTIVQEFAIIYYGDLQSKKNVKAMLYKLISSAEEIKGLAMGQHYKYFSYKRLGKLFTEYLLNFCVQFYEDEE